MINEGDSELCQSFNITQGLLVEHSALFEAACRNDWKEATTRTIKLPDVNNETFYAYLYWTYKEKIPLDTDWNRGDGPDVYACDAMPTLEEIIKLWLLADRLITAKLRNAAADTILRILKHIPDVGDMDEAFPASTIALIWSATTKDRALRRIVIDVYAYRVHPQIIEGSIEDYHPDFVKDLALKGLRIGQGLEKNQCPTSQQPGHYHELDRSHPRSNIFGTAQIDLKDRDEVVLRYESTLFETPQSYIDSVHRHVSRCDTPGWKYRLKMILGR